MITGFYQPFMNTAIWCQSANLMQEQCVQTATDSTNLRVMSIFSARAPFQRVAYSYH